MHPMDAKKQLGREIVRRFHGSAAAEAAEESFVSRFRDNQIPDEMPEFSFPGEGAGILLCKLLALTEVVPSNSEGRRAIKQGGVKVNGEKITDENLEITCQGEYILQVGKRRFAKVMYTE